MDDIVDKKASFIREQHDVLNGRAKILRTTQSGDVYQIRMWVPGEKKYVRQSLGTTDLVTAMDRAETKALEVYSDVKAGKKLFGITLSQLIDRYLAYRQSEDVVQNNITPERLLTIRSQLKHLVAFKGADTKMSYLDKSSCYEYANWRRKDRPTVKDVTIRNETATINHLIKYGYRNGYCHVSEFEFRKLRVRHDEVVVRDTFTIDEYDHLVRFMRSWNIGQLKSDSAKERLERTLIRYCVLAASNTMLRVGELWQLTWGDINSYEKVVDEVGQEITMVNLTVRGVTSKVRKTRTITTRGGEYFQKLSNEMDAPDRSSLIFSVDGKATISRNRLYAYWKDLMLGIGIENYQQRNLTWYSLRHFGITCRLKAGASLFDIAKIAGTSAAHIESTYGHFDQEMSKAVAKLNFTSN